MDSTDSFELDPPHTLLGQLQRGLGRGFLAARAKKSTKTSDALLRCIIEDPRWDQQLEQRASYYARLALNFELSLTPLIETIRAAAPEAMGFDGSLAADVLAELAARGDQAAEAALREELRGPAWLIALEAIDYVEDEYGMTFLASDDILGVVERMDPELHYKVVFETGLPWKKWAELEPRVNTFLRDACPDEEPRPRSKAATPDTSLSTAELLAMAEPRNSLRLANVLAQRRDAKSVTAMVECAMGDQYDQQMAALRALGAQGNPRILDWVIDLLSSERIAPKQKRQRIAAHRYLEALPGELTLPLAREWLNTSEAKARASECIFARHARAEDRPNIEDALARALDEGEVYRTYNLVDALAVIADARSTPLLVQVFEHTPYSRTRSEVLRALQTNGSELGARLGEESLWDCESEARELGISMAHDTDRVHERIQEIAEDRFEENLTKQAAHRWLEEQGEPK